MDRLENIALAPAVAFIWVCLMLLGLSILALKPFVRLIEKLASS
jgi:hypothetical protein